MTTRVLFLNQGTLGGGVMMGPTAVADALRKGLAGTSIEPDFLTLAPWSRAERLLGHDVPGLVWADADLHALRWVLVESWRGRRALRRATKATSYDAVHVTSHTPGMLLGRTPSCRYFCVDATIDQWESMGVLHPERRWSPAMRGLAVRLERRTMRQATAVIAFSGWAAAGVRALVPEATVEVIHPGVDLEHFRPDSSGVRAAGPTRILMVASRFKEKGGHDLLAALTPRLGRDITLDVVTRQPVTPQPGVTIHSLTGSSPELVELYRRADLVCLPTYADTSPWVLLEAMACAVPVIGTAVGGLPELIGAAGDRGLLIAPGDIAGLRSAIEKLLADPDLRMRMGAAGRAHVEANHNVVVQGQKLARLIAGGSP
jgi:glycosyltransferase involved in cell wall biosynthesis